MNDFVILVIIWIIITLISQLTKKTKKQQKKVPPIVEPPSKQKAPEIPPFLRDLFGLPEEVEQQQSKKEIDVSTLNLPLEKEEELPALGELEDVEHKEILVEKVEELAKEIGSEQFEISDDRKIADILSGVKIEKSKIKKYSSFIHKRSLKEAYIIKEILDKPISFRKYFRFNSSFRL